MHNCFVAFFDMLGMTALVRRDPELAWQALCALSAAKDERLRLAIKRLDTGEVIYDQIRDFMFSDTIVAFSKSDSDNDALAIMLLSTELFAASLHNCVPLRGGIAHGQFEFNLEHNLFLGPALLDAYQLGESSQWLGIYMDEEVAEAASRLPVARSARGNPIVVSWEVPCKGGTTESREVVNWPESHRANYTGPVPPTAEIFYSPFCERFGPFHDLEESVRAKYENTVDFFNAQYK